MDRAPVLVLVFGEIEPGHSVRIVALVGRIKWKLLPPGDQRFQCLMGLRRGGEGMQ